jgi:hypothetical protein
MLGVEGPRRAAKPSGGTAMAQTTPQEIPPRFQVSRMISSTWVPQAIYAAAKLGLPDVLAGGPLPAPTVAEKAGTHPAATARLLRSLVVLGLASQDDDGRFGTDLNMLVMVGGQERTETEYRELVGSAGLRVTRIIPTPAAMSLIEAVVH